MNGSGWLISGLDPGPWINQLASILPCKSLNIAAITTRDRYSDSGYPCLMPAGVRQSAWMPPISALNVVWCTSFSLP